MYMVIYGFAHGRCAAQRFGERHHPFGVVADRLRVCPGRFVTFVSPLPAKAPTFSGRFKARHIQ
jgi:hypothetical protein